MRVLAISCSPHKEGLSPGLLKAAAEGAREAGADVDVVLLAEKKIRPCIACPSPPCWTAMECNIKDDDALALRDKFNRCDALIISAPVYFLGLNGMGKDFLDRMRYYGENGKPALPIVAAGGTGKGCVKALQDLSISLTIFGFRIFMPMPVTRYNADEAFQEVKERGRKLVREYVRKPFSGLSEGYKWLLSSPYMDWDLVDEILFLTKVAIEGLRRKGKEDLASRFSEELSALEGYPENKIERAISLQERVMNAFNVS